jgi:hypothetical protein
MDLQYLTTIQYDYKSLELTAGLYAIAVDDKSSLANVYDVVMAAVKLGEFDEKLMAIKRVGTNNGSLRGLPSVFKMGLSKKVYSLFCGVVQFARMQRCYDVPYLSWR